jgi:AraC-like DNA-binding protein
MFSSFLMILLGVIFFFNPSGKKLSNYLLSGFIIANAVLLTNFFLQLKFPSYHSEFSIIYTIGTHCYFLLAPLVYLYIISLCRPGNRISKKWVLHLLPFFIITFLTFYLKVLTKNTDTNLDKVWYYFFVAGKLALYIQIAAYIGFSFIELKQYRLQIKELYSNLMNIDLIWVNLVLYFFILMCLVDMLCFILIVFNKINSPFTYYLGCLSISTDLVLSVSLIFKGMQQAAIHAEIITLPKYSLDQQDVTNYEKNKILLLQCMNNEKPYLLPELNLNDLAKMINLSPKYLSQTINFCFKQNFNSFINQYRVDESKRIIESDKADKKTVFEILLDSGFNSKSVFNGSFKKLNGYTPKEYREKLKKNKS